MNSPALSKINWTALIMAAIGASVALGLVPKELEKPLTDMTLIIGPMLIATFRTWFTGPK